MPDSALLPSLVFLASFLGTGLMRRIAPRLGWIAQPRKDRWHQKPTALLGGLGFYPIFLLGFLVVLSNHFGFPIFQFFSLHDLPPALLLSVALFAGSILMFFCGLVDDLQHFRPTTKLIFQFVAASGVILAGGVFPLTGFRFLDILVTYLWFVGIINAVNMLDNMDGLCAGVMIIAGITIILMAGLCHVDAPLFIHLGWVFVAALGGFLVHNWPPAAIFMGDCGSMFAGFVLATLAMPSSLNGQMGIGRFEASVRPIMTLLLPVTVLALPIFDTALVTVTRILRAQKPTQGGRDHSSHRLVALGWSEKKAVWTLYSLGALGGGLAILMQHRPEHALLIFGLFAFVLGLVGIYLGRVKV